MARFYQIPSQNKLEAQYAARRDAHQSELADLRQQLEMKNHEVRSLNVSIDSLKSLNEELKVGFDYTVLEPPLIHCQRAFAVTSDGIEGGKNLAESAQDLERTRKAINVQLAEFDGVKKSLMRDLQNRCEKVVELEIQLDEIKEQYNNVIRNSNSKAQQKKMAFLERNLEQLTLVQKQVEPRFSWPLVLLSDVFCASLSIRTLRSRRRLELPNESCLQETSGYKISKPYFKMLTGGLPCRTRSLRHSFRLSRTDWIKLEVQYKSCFVSIQRSEFLPAQKSAVPSPLSFAGRIAKPLRGGGGGVVPSAATETPVATVVSVNPLSRVQNEEGYAIVSFIIVASLD
jgi:kinesin family protein 5